MKPPALRPSRRQLLAGAGSALALAALPGLAQTPQRIRTGLDRLLADPARWLNGRRYALLSHAAGVDGAGVQGIDRLAALTGALRPAALWSAEHGLGGTAAAGEAVPDGIDAATRLPVFSLYGVARAPSAAMLAAVDAIVIDLQDVGVRPYTYASTVKAVQRAAAAAGRAVILLDRPNPLGGVTVAGPMRAPALDSFVGAHDVAYRHGMTLGELARMFAAEEGWPAPTVLAMEGWERASGAASFGPDALPYVPPSPNLPTLSSVAAYPATLWIEGTNLSEGRGTPRPFELVGAPFVRERALVRALRALELPGVAWHPLRFVPSVSKHQGLSCGGAGLRVTDAAAFDPVRTGAMLLATLFQLYPDEITWTGAPERPFIDLLSGDARLRAAVMDGTPLEPLLADWTIGAARFAARREPYLLY